MNITLHLSIDDFDCEVPGTNSIIIVQATAENIAKIGRILGKGLAKSAYIYLLGSMTQAEIESWLDKLVKAAGDFAGCVKTLQQKNICQVALNHNLFSMGESMRDTKQKTLCRDFVATLKLLHVNPVFIVQNDTKPQSFMAELANVGLSNLVCRQP